MSAARRASSQLLSSRSVHLRIVPRPANLSESREIFRVLQQFGEISTYKSLRYEYHNPAHNIALAIYRDADSAQQALNASPLRFALERVVDEDNESAATQLNDKETDTDDIPPNIASNPSVDEMLRPSTLVNRTHPNLQNPYTTPTTPKAEPPMPLEQTPPIRKIQSKWFQVTVDRSRVIHQDYVERQPYWTGFTPMKSMAQEDLAKVVPHVGLSDVSKRPPFAHRTPASVMKIMARYVDKKMPSLKQMYEEGGRE